MFFILLIFSGMVLPQEHEEDYSILTKDVYIKLEVTMCIRHCPSYNVTIKGDGVVDYEGEIGVTKLGKFTKHISKNDVAKLISVFFNSKFFTRTDESTDCFTQTKLTESGAYERQEICYTSNHGPFVNIEAKYGNLQRKVSLEHLFSEDYWKLKQSIIDAAGVKRWVRKKN